MVWASNYSYLLWHRQRLLVPLLFLGHLLYVSLIYLLLCICHSCCLWLQKLCFAYTWWSKRNLWYRFWKIWGTHIVVDNSRGQGLDALIDVGRILLVLLTKQLQRLVVKTIERVLVWLWSIACRKPALRKLAARSFLRLLWLNQFAGRLLVEVPFQRGVLRWVLAAVW